MSLVNTISSAAAAAARHLAILEESEKNTVLLDMAAALREQQVSILTANEIDVSEAQKKQFVLSNDRPSNPQP